jgi:hypothetical protein
LPDFSKNNQREVTKNNLLGDLSTSNQICRNIKKRQSTTANLKSNKDKHLMGNRPSEVVVTEIDTQNDRVYAKICGPNKGSNEKNENYNSETPERFAGQTKGNTESTYSGLHSRKSAINENVFSGIQIKPETS